MDNVEFGSRIRQARESLGMSQEELAVLVSKTQNSISKYENGTQRMFVNDLVVFSQALKVPISYFFTGQIIPDEMNELILTAIQQLPTMKAKQTLLKIIEAVSDLTQSSTE